MRRIDQKFILTSEPLTFDKKNQCDLSLGKAGLHSSATCKTAQPIGIRLSRFCFKDSDLQKFKIEALTSTKTDKSSFTSSNYISQTLCQSACLQYGSYSCS